MDPHNSTSETLRPPESMVPYFYPSIYSITSLYIDTPSLVNGFLPLLLLYAVFKGAEFTQIYNVFYQGIEILTIKGMSEITMVERLHSGGSRFIPPNKNGGLSRRNGLTCVCVVMCRFRPLHHLSDRAVCITEAPYNAESALVRSLSYCTCTSTSGDS